jgi:hypothetical protein
MQERTAPDRMSQFVWLILAIVGAVLAVVGWYRYAGGYGLAAVDRAGSFLISALALRNHGRSRRRM